MNKHIRNLLAILALPLISTLHPVKAFAQGTAFTYQGRLSSSGTPATGSYDLRFIPYNAGAGGSAITGPVTNSTVAVSNGLFTTTVDFGQGVFSGQLLWLDVSVSPAGSNTFTELTPRQLITSTPYAIQAASATVAATANSVSAANINGTINEAQLPPTVVTEGAANVNVSGSFSGNGAGISGVNLVNINSDGLINWKTNWGTFTTAASLSATYPLAITAADVNGDGKADLICANGVGNTLTVFTNDGTGGFVEASFLEVGSYPNSIKAADVNGDGKVDLICADGNGTTLTVLTNNGSGGFTIASSPTVGTYPQSVITADVNGDGKVDLICVVPLNNMLTVLTNNGSGGFVTAASPAVGNYPVSVTAADVNGDGKIDLICVNTDDGTLSVLTNNGSGGFAIASSPAVGIGAGFITAADVNGDGKVDLICVGGAANTLTILTNNGTGGFTIASSPAVGSQPNYITTADVNSDGKIDLICSDGGDNTLTVLTNNGSGGFVIASSLAVGSYPVGVAAADINGDGKVDLISANYDSSTLTVLTNTAIFSNPVIGGSSTTFSGNGTGLNWGTASYTPVIGDGTHNFTTSTAQGYYSQMGNVTFVEIRLVWTSKGSATAGSALQVSLPFAVGSSPRATFNPGFVSGITYTGQLMANSNVGQTNANFWSVASGTITPLPVSSCAASGEIQISGFFRP